MNSGARRWCITEVGVRTSRPLAMHIKVLWVAPALEMARCPNWEIRMPRDGPEINHCRLLVSHRPPFLSRQPLCVVFCPHHIARSGPLQLSTSILPQNVSRPDRILIDLAAGRSLSGPVYDATVDSAIEHRMAGLLWTRAQKGAISAPQEVRERLESLDLQAWARARMLESALGQLLEVAKAVGVRVALIKGLATAGRWYDRPAERWAYDLDIVVYPSDLSGVDDLVALLYPDHPLIGQIGPMVRRRHLQSVDLGVTGMPVDIHLDPLKLELVWSTAPERYWGHMTEVPLGDGLSAPAFDNNVSLFLHLLHLNKDHFRRLIGYADIVRGGAQANLDWNVVIDFAAGEGVAEHVLNTAHAVEEELQVDLALPGLDRTWRSVVWARSWPRESRLLGVSQEVHRHRLFVIPLTAVGRTFSAASGWLRRLWPPRLLLDYYYPGVRGIYPVKLLRARINRRRPPARAADDVAPKSPR